MLENLLQIFVFFILGYTARRLKIIPQEYSKAYIDYIMNFGFPALVVYNIYRLRFSLDVLSIIILGWIAIFLTILASYLISKSLKLDKKRTVAFIMMSTFSNTGFLGYPFIHSLYGEEGLRYAVIFDNLAMFLPIFLLAPFIINYAKEGSIKINIKKLLLFPPFIALVIGVSLKPFDVPEIFLNLLKTLGMTVIPIILFSVGLNLRFSHIGKDLKLLTVNMLVKLFASPLILLLILLILKIDLTLPYKVAILQLAMPPMVLASIYLIDADLEKDFSVSSVAIGIILSFLTVPIWYFLMNSLSHQN